MLKTTSHLARITFFIPLQKFHASQKDWSFSSIRKFPWKSFGSSSPIRISNIIEKNVNVEMLGISYGMLVNVQGWNLIRFFFNRNKSWLRLRFCSFNKGRSKYFPTVWNWRNELILDELVMCSNIVILSLCDVSAPMLCSGNEEHFRRSL